MAYLCAMHLKEGFVLRELGDEHIVIGEGLTVDFQRLVSLNSSAAFLWRGVEGREFGVDDLTALLLDEYEAAAPVPSVPAAPVPAPAAASAPAAAPAAPAAGPVAAGTKVDSPLPGNVLQVKVSVGQAVKAGDVLVIIEAMKMENEVAAPCDGTVKQIVANKGAVVATGDTLLVI